MSPEDATHAFIIETQIKLFDDARHDLQLPITKIAEKARLSVKTVNAWAQGRNALSLWGVKRLLRVPGLAPLLSRLFEPEEFALIGVVAGIDLDELAAHCRTFLDEKDKAHHPDSEAGRDLGPNETKSLNRTRLTVVGGTETEAA